MSPRTWMFGPFAIAIAACSGSSNGDGTITGSGTTMDTAGVAGSDGTSTASGAGAGGGANGAAPGAAGSSAGAQMGSGPVTNTAGSSNPAGAGGSGAVGMPPGMPTGAYASSWLGFQSPDEVTGTNLVPVVSSDCPVDPDMAKGTALFQDSAGSPDALLFDWAHNYGGWHSAAIGPPGWAVLTVPASAKLVFWIKGNKGGEEAAFTLRVNFHDNTNTDTLWPPAIPAVTTSWQKITMPLSAFGNGNYAAGIASIGTGNSHAAMHARYYIDNIYFTAE
jgi:hypothetical protein